MVLVLVLLCYAGIDAGYQDVIQDFMFDFKNVSMMLCPIPGSCQGCYCCFEDVVQEVISDIKMFSKSLWMLSQDVVSDSRNLSKMLFLVPAW